MIGARLPIYLALGASIGVVGAYLLAGGASYKPLAAADPCLPRSAEVLAERGVFEAIVLSALDGAACDLGVSREELTTALADEQALLEFSEARDVSDGEIDSAVRSGLLRATDDAISSGRLPEPAATVVRLAAENLPISLVLDVFQALPGDPSIPEILEALQDVGLGLEDAQGLFEGFLDGLDPSGELGLDQLPGLLPEGIPGLAP